MQKYILKGEGYIVEAIRLDESNAEELADISGGIIVQERDPDTEEFLDALNVPTVGGFGRLSRGDWLVKEGGRFYIVKPHLFSRVYEVVSNDTPVTFTPDPRERKRI